jgi:hypothetical protein
MFNCSLPEMNLARFTTFEANLRHKFRIIEIHTDSIMASASRSSASVYDPWTL